MKARALDLFSGAGGISEGLRRAGFEVTAIDIRPQPHHRGGHFLQADCLEVLLDLEFLRSFDFIHASPPCQAYSSLRHLQAGKVYPDLIPATRTSLLASGVAYSIENVEGAPLGSSGFLTMLCGTMFGLQTPDGRAEIRRHRLFETSFSIPLRPACQHGYVSRENLSVNGTGLDSNKERWVARSTITVTGDRPNSFNTPRKALTVTGHSYHTVHSHPDSRPERRKTITVVGPKGMPGLSHARRAMTVTGSTPQTNTVHNQVRETFSIADARAAMGIDWMPMKSLSQAIPPAYGEWIGREALAFLTARK